MDATRDLHGGPEPSAPHPMDSIEVRPLRFRTESIGDDALVWSASSPAFAIYTNALGVHVPHFERFLVRVLREVRGDLSDAALRRDVQGIIGQEANHAHNFEGWTRRLALRYPVVARLDLNAKAGFDRAFEHGSRKRKLGFVAGYETFTFLAGMIILDRYEELMGEADPRIRAMWVWHQVEEVEHGAVAFDVFKAFHGDCEWYRRMMVLAAASHILVETFKAFAPMVRTEVGYRRPLQALRTWAFFARFSTDLFVSALPVFRRSYHPRRHPRCNGRQNRIAVAWRAWTAAGGDARELDDHRVAQWAARQGSAS